MKDYDVIDMTMEEFENYIAGFYSDYVINVCQNDNVVNKIKIKEYDPHRVRMYKDIIYLKKELSLEKCKELESIANGYFNNRAGKIANSSDDSYVLLYQGSDEDAWGTLSIGELDLFDDKDFLEYIEKWIYINEYNPDDNGDVLEAFSRVVAV